MNIQQMPDAVSPLDTKSSGRVAFAAIGIRVDSPYADPAWMQKKYNSEPLYQSNADITITKVMAERLRQANEILRVEGLQILIWDSYRPASAQQILWDWGENSLDGPTAQYIGPPGESDHNFGLAVDLTLTNIHGEHIAMPSEFDHFEPAYAHPPRQDAVGNFIQPKRWRTEAFENWKKLHAAMTAVDLACHPEEWWHYSPVEWEAAKAAGDQARLQFLRRFGFKRLLTQDELESV